MIAAEITAQSPPDGYRLLMGTVSTHGTNAAVYSKLGYDPVKDFAPIALVASAPLMLVAGLVVSSLAAFLTLRKYLRV